jgi:hypothetical protein
MSRNILTGLVGAWCPSLGPSGYTLLDRSGRGNHGTLTNMDAATDWVGTPGGWALDFDGTNDYVLAGLNLNLLPIVSFSCFAIIRNASSSFAIFGNDNNKWGRVIRGSTTATTATFQILNTTGISALSGSVPLNTLFHLHVFWSTASMKLAINGKIVSTASGEAAIYDDATVINLARSGPSGLTLLLDGQLGDIAIHNRQLSSGEIAALYTLGRGGLGRLLTQRTQRRVFRTQVAAKSYLFVNNGQVIGGGML